MINALEKTRVEKDPDFIAEREERDRRVNAIEREKAKLQMEEERLQAEERKRIADQKAYKGLHDEDLECNVGEVADEDDFM